MEFYSVKHRRKVDVAQDKIQKKVIENTTKNGKLQRRYMLQAQTDVDGDQVKLTKFVDEQTYNSIPG
jgi:hypothetical protein